MTFPISLTSMPIRAVLIAFCSASFAACISFACFPLRSTVYAVSPMHPSICAPTSSDTIWSFRIIVSSGSAVKCAATSFRLICDGHAGLAPSSIILLSMASAISISFAPGFINRFP